MQVPGPPANAVHQAPAGQPYPGAQVYSGPQSQTGQSYVVISGGGPMTPVNGTKSRGIFGISVAITVIGVFTVLVGIAVVVLDGVNPYWRSVGHIGVGIWTGGLFIVAGILGIMAGRTPWNRCLMISFLVLTIVGILLSIVLIGRSSAFVGIFDSVLMFQSDGQAADDILRAFLGLYSVLLIFGVVLFVILIIASALVCCYWGCCCCCRQPRSPAPGVAFSAPAPGTTYTVTQGGMAYYPQTQGTTYYTTSPGMAPSVQPQGYPYNPQTQGVAYYSGSQGGAPGVTPAAVPLKS